MPPKNKGSSNVPKQRTIRCVDDESSPGSCRKGSRCRFLHEQPSDQITGAEAVSDVQAAAPKPFGFGNLDVEKYRQAALRIVKSRGAVTNSPQSVQNHLKEFWDAIVGNVFPPTIASAVAMFQSRIQLKQFDSIPVAWPQSVNDDLMHPSMVEAALSQLILQRDFVIGLLGYSSPDVLDFLALDATFLQHLKSSLASPALCPHQTTSCLPHIIRSIMKSQPMFLEIMLQLLPSTPDVLHAAEPARIAHGARLCHVLQYSFGFDSGDMKLLYARLLTNPLSSFGGPQHSGEWRAVSESPPRRYNTNGDPLGTITKYCVDDEEGEGQPCLHRKFGPDRAVLRRNHWSCCGGPNQFDTTCINATSSSTSIRSSGLQCPLAHILTVRVCLPNDLPIDVACTQCGLHCLSLSVVSTFCSVCNQSICLACAERINKVSVPDAKTLEKKKEDADSGSSRAGGGAVGGGGAGKQSADSAGTETKPAVSSLVDLMSPAIATFVEDCHSGAGWLLAKILCDAIDKKQLLPHDIHTIQLLLTALNLDLFSLNENSSFDMACCRSLAGAIAAALARLHPSSYSDRDISLDLRSQRDSSTIAGDAAATEIPYLSSVRKLIHSTKRFKEFADALLRKIHEDYSSPAELLSLTEDRNRLLIVLEVAYFELKHPASKSKCGTFKQLLEMGCFPRKFAMKAVLKSSSAEGAVNFFFSESRTASDEDEREDAVLTNAAKVCEALKSFIKKSSQPLKDSSDQASGAQPPRLSEIEAKFDFLELRVAISTACSSFELFSDLQELTYPIMKNLCDRVEVVAQEQKSVSSHSCDISESDRRFFLQSLIQSFSHTSSMPQLRCTSVGCTSGHPLVFQNGQNPTKCTNCSVPISTSIKHYSCRNPKSVSSSSKQCNFTMCSSCGADMLLAQSATYSQFDIASSTHAISCLIPHSELQENMTSAFASIAGSADLAVAPVVPFGWKVPDIPIPRVPSGDICGPDCSQDHNDDSAICIRCDRRPSSHTGHLCNDEQRGYFIHKAPSQSQGRSPSVHGPPGTQQITMHHSSARPISLVHSEAGLFVGRKWTCTLICTGERGQNTWIGLCDANIVAQYACSADFKGLGTRGKGYSIGFHHELGLRIDDKTTPRPFTFKDGDGISIEYDEPGRRLDVIVDNQVVYSHAGLPPNLMFAISSGDKKSQYAAVKCRQVDVPSSLDAHRSSILDSITKAIFKVESWKSEKVFSLLSLLSSFRTKPHHVLSSKFLHSTQAALLRIVSELIESDDLNAITIRHGACDRIFRELAHIVDFDRKPLLLACIVQIKRVSIALLQGRNTLSKHSLGFLSKLYAACSKGFAQTTAAAFEFLIKCTTNLEASKSTVEYLRIPRWVIDTIDPSRSFLSIYNMLGACFPAMLHSGWVDVETKDGKSVRLSCEAAQVLMHRDAKDPLISAPHALAPVLKIGRVAASIDRELSTNGLLQDLHDDCGIVQTPLHTAALPSSIHIGSGCIDCVAWLKARLHAQDRLNEIEALTTCCQETECPPAVVQAVITDLVRRAFVIRERGHILLAGSKQHGEKVLLKADSADASHDSPPSTQFTTQPIFGVFPQSDAYKVSHAVFFTIEDSADPSPWSSSISSASSLSIKDFEIDLADTLYGLLKLEHSNDILKAARKFEECSGSVTAYVFKHDGDCASSDTSIIAYSKGFCPVCLDDDTELACSPCGHLACINCYRHLLRTAIDDSGSPLLAKGYDNLISITAIKCMDVACEEHLPLSFLQEVVPDLADVTRRILVRTLLRVLNNSSCPISSCLCGQSMLIGTSQDCEAVCFKCGRCATIGDFKRKEIPGLWIPHSTISSEENLNWIMLNDPGNSSRRDLMRFKGCPHCGTITTRCGCEPSKIECDNLERCPNERCDHIDCTVCKKRWCWVCGSPSCPTRCSKPALERTHRKEKFLLSQNAIANMTKSMTRIDEQHMFHRARSEFLKLFYRAPDKIDAADPCLSQQLLPALSKRDFDAIRFCLFEQALQKSKMHVALLWLAFATLPESFVLKVLTENDTIISISSAFYDFLALSQSSSSIAVTKFQPSISNESLVFAEENQSAMRPGSVSTYPMARAPMTRVPGYKPHSSRSFSVVLERAPNNSNSTSFGLAARSISSSGSDGVGGTANSWGVICTYGNGSNTATKVMASGRQVASWRMLREGDMLRAQYFPDGSLHVSLNLMECEHRFDLPPEVVSNFGASSNPEEDTYTFAMTLASDHRARIC